jgi:hypothetical protein
MKALEVGESCGTHRGGKGKFVRSFGAKLEENLSDDLSVCGRVI